MSLALNNSPGNPSADLNTPETGEFAEGVLGSTYMCADIQMKEDPRYQDDLLKACTISNAVPASLTVTASSTTTYTFITAYGFSLREIEADFKIGW